MLKISFSTLGCPNWMWNEIQAAAKDLGYQGIELRGIGADLFVPQMKIFHPENLPKTRDNLARNHLEIACISTECLLHSTAPEMLAKAKSYLDLASALGVRYIRVLGDTNPWPDDTVDEEIVYKNLLELVPYAKEKNVVMLVETNGIYADSKILRALIERISSPSVQVLWDINHPVRYFAETPEETWENIGAYVRHAHVKDSVMESGRMIYKMLGYGDLPIKAALKLMKENGFDGYVSLEWTKRWNDELEDAGVVFSHFSHTIRQMWDAV